MNSAERVAPRSDEELRELDKTIHIVLGGSLDDDPPRYSSQVIPHHWLIGVIESHGLAVIYGSGFRLGKAGTACQLSPMRDLKWRDGWNSLFPRRWYGFGATMSEAFMEAAVGALPSLVANFGLPKSDEGESRRIDW